MMKHIFGNARLFRLFLNLWPPFLFSGIKITKLADDFRYCKVDLKWWPWTLNANRTQYGGSMFSMTDPIYCLMLMNVLGKEYYVWDKNSDIDFLKPGKGRLTAEFILSDDTIQKIIDHTASGEKFFPEFIVNVVDEKGDIVCKLCRRIYVRKKPKYREGEE
ncbi:DUF4442 domain-containing protein [Algicola sagamiensis]|uniref:DUF4442 domain-containing protein n=1 Tax=Algicola sagamiensis TaxID=163869 RepID=UPI00037F1932|nr:DUF4442 domain-containing protein [Algicola sagamiensis]